MTSHALPEHIRAVFLRRDVGRVLRAALTPGHVALIVAAGAIPPEVEAPAAWHSLDGVRVAVVPYVRGLEVASARAPSAAAQLATDPPQRCAWCLYVSDAATTCAVVPFPVIAPRPTGSPSTPAAAA